MYKLIKKSVEWFFLKTAESYAMTSVHSISPYAALYVKKDDEV